MLKLKLTILAFFLVIANGFSQNLGLTHYTIDDGLPSNNVFNLYFDSKGYMWIGTDKGIARYNGIEFKTFTTYDGLPDNEVFGFYEDSEGRLWIANFKGVLCYYKDNIFHTAKNTPWLKLNRKSFSNFYNTYEQQEDGDVLTESADGKALLIIGHKTIKELSLVDVSKRVSFGDWRSLLMKKVSSNKIQLYYRHSYFVIDTFSKIQEVQNYKDTFSRFPVTEKNVPLLGITKGILTRDQQIIYAIPDAKYSYPDFKIQLCALDARNVFMASKYGVYHNGLKILKEPDYTSISADNTGNIWLSSLSNGIFCFNKNFETSSLYHSPINDKIKASGFVGNNLHLVNENGGEYIIPGSLKSLSPRPENCVGNTVLFNGVNTCITPWGDIFSVQRFQILHKKAGENNYRNIHFLINSPTDGIPICKFINYLDSTFFITTTCNVIIAKYADVVKSNTFIVKPEMIFYSSSVQDRIYHGAIRLSDTSLWFSQSDRISHVKKNGTVIQEKELNNITFRQFEFYKNYLAGFTDDNKFYIYNTVSKKLDSIVESSCIWESLCSVNDTTAIINTNNSYKILTLLPTSKDGKPGYNLVTVENPFIPRKADYIFGKGDTYYFLKNGELSSFPASMVAGKPLPPSPVFVSVKTKQRTYPGLTFINLPYNQSKSITVQIDNISFNDENLTTQYSISKDENDNWNTITSNEINLNAIGMGYGKYIIKLRSKTRASGFSKPAVLILQIATPFWAKWWFITLCIIVFILLILIIVRLIIWRQLRKKQKEFDSEMKYQQSEYKALNALMNPHFIFNSLNNIQGLINKDHKETANQYLVIFSKLIRQNMLNISKGYISLYKEMVLIENYLYLEKLRFKELINFTINIDPEIDTESVMIPPLLIQPLVENAIIHGLLPMQSENSRLSIRIFEIDDVVHIEVEDNGIGLTQSLKKKNENSDSYGLSNLHRRIEHVKKFQQGNIEFEIKELVDKDGNTLGTKASITIEQL